MTQEFETFLVICVDTKLAPKKKDLLISIVSSFSTGHGTTYRPIGKYGWVESKRCPRNDW